MVGVIVWSALVSSRRLRVNFGVVMGQCIFGTWMFLVCGLIEYRGMREGVLQWDR